MRSKDRRAIVIWCLLTICVTALSTRDLSAFVAEQPPLQAEVSETEHIYICLLYGPDKSAKSRLVASLGRMGAHRAGTDWTYENPAQNKSYVIHIVENVTDMINALYTEGAHVIINGHANYGMGGVFATSTELRRQTISNIRFIDDDRIMNYSTPVFSLSISGLIEHQSYPNWGWFFKDGTSGIMPYDFNDPQGDPPYNYYLTYQVLGDPAYYKIENVNNSAIERFPDSDRPGWYSPDGSLPDPANSDHQQYYITNPATAFQLVGRWLTSTSVRGYYGDSFCYTPAGAAGRQVKWAFAIPEAGMYSVSAWWPASYKNTSSASYSINHASGTTLVKVNQRSKGTRWNSLGDFYFEAGDYSVLLSDSASAGTVVADAVRITSKTSASAFDLIIDNTDCPNNHYRRKTVLFRKDLDIDQSKLGYKRMFYESCNSGIYYIETFHRGVMFYTLHDSYGMGVNAYLKAYLDGKSDEEIWAALQQVEPIYDYYDFSKKPAEQ